MPRKKGKAKKRATSPRGVARDFTATAAEPNDPVALGLPTCDIRRDGGKIRVVMHVEGLLAAGGLFQVIPVFGPVPPVPEEKWEMTSSSSGVDSHDMKTEPKHLENDGINFQINLCAMSNQFTSGAVEVTVEQDGEQRPVAPPMRFDLDDVAPCQSPAAKLKPTQVVGGFAFRLT
jgi:hypothetical protein